MDCSLYFGGKAGCLKNISYHFSVVIWALAFSHLNVNKAVSTVIILAESPSELIYHLKPAHETLMASVGAYS